MPTNMGSDVVERLNEAQDRYRFISMLLNLAWSLGSQPIIGMFKIYQSVCYTFWANPENDSNQLWIQHCLFFRSTPDLRKLYAVKPDPDSDIWIFNSVAPLMRVRQWF